MDRLPIEIREHVYSFLSNNSLFCSALVCTSWNTVVTPLLYGTVLLSKPQSKKLFYDTIYAPSRRRHLNALIREIHFLDYDSLKGGFRPDNSADLSRALPHLQLMIGYDLEAATKDAAHHPDGPMANTQMRNRLVTNARSQHEREYMILVSQNHTKINGIAIRARNDRSFRGFRGLLDYLQLFPQIHYLIIEYDETPAATNELFLQVLSQCSLLTHIYYGPGLKTDRMLDTTDYREYPSMRHLKLPVQHLTRHHIQYLQQTFPRMQFLKLIINDTCYDREVIRKLIHAFINRNPLEWEFNNYYTLMETIDILDDFWAISDSANDERHPRRIMRNMIYWTGIHAAGTPSLYFSLCGGDYTMNCMVEVFSPEPALFHIFNRNRESILNLVIYDYPEVISLNAVNQAFPHLKSLELHGTVTSIEDTPTINPALVYLSVPSVCMAKTPLHQLHTMYPNLTGLHIKTTSIPSCSMDTVDLPWTDLKHVHIDSLMAPPLLTTVAIVHLNSSRKVTRSWLYDPHHNTLTEQNTHLTLRSFMDHLHKPVFVLTSLSITHVKMDCGQVDSPEVLL